MILRVAVALCGWFALLCGLAVGMGTLGGVPESVNALGMLSCDPPDVPCLMGVTPGATLWTDMETHFASAGQNVLTAESGRFSLHVARVEFAEFYPSIDSTKVGRIFARLPPDTLTIGWLLRIYGVPCGVSVYARAGMITLRYPLLLVNIDLEVQPFDLHAAVRRMSYADPAFQSDFQPNRCVDNVTDGVVNMYWNGVLPLQRLTRRIIGTS